MIVVVAVGCSCICNVPHPYSMSIYQRLSNCDITAILLHCPLKYTSYIAGPVTRKARRNFINESKN